MIIACLLFNLVKQKRDYIPSDSSGEQLYLILKIREETYIVNIIAKRTCLKIRLKNIISFYTIYIPNYV